MTQQPPSFSSYFAALSYDRPTVLRNLQEHQVGAVDGASCQFLYSIYDGRLAEYGPPTPSQSGFIIARGLAHLIKTNPSIPFATFPGDFVVFCLGRFNTRMGTIVPYSTPQPIGSIKTIIEAVTPGDLVDFLTSLEALTALQPKPESK